jgi:flagellar biosynthesis protein FlhF
MRLVSDSLGSDALVLSVKNVKPTGIFAFMKKAYVEVVAAADDALADTAPLHSGDAFINALNKSLEKADEKAQIKSAAAAGDKKNELSAPEEPTEAANLLAGVARGISVAEQSGVVERKYDAAVLQLFYTRLTSRGVLPNVAEALLEDVSYVTDCENLNINLIVQILYSKIMLMLGEPSVIGGENGAKVVFFVGPTGVGKTTTIAKISSWLKLRKHLNVSFVTADTYRIAAVEQLKTYADILGIDVGVAYNAGDFAEILRNKPENNLVLVDTAGRSHRNAAEFSDLTNLINAATNFNQDSDPKGSQSREIYLVLSVTTKYDDLISIINTYKPLAEAVNKDGKLNVIFTKTDETMSLGTIINVCFETGVRTSYITSGQNVPDDISVINPGGIARALLC